MTREKQVNVFLELELEFDANEDKEYIVKAIKNSAVHKKVVKGQLQRLYNLVS